MRATIKDIVRETGLSPTAVSLVLNNKPHKLSADSQRLIRETAKRLNYRPNQIAVGLVTRQTLTLGLIIPDISNQYFSALALGIDEEAAKQGRNIILSNTNDKSEQDLNSLQVMASRGVDAIILAIAGDINADIRPRYREFVEGSTAPVILVDRDDPFLQCSSVKLNNHTGAYNAIRHLYELGHREIACVTGAAGLNSTAERLDGVRQACRDFGLPFRDENVIASSYTAHGGQRAAEAILEGAHKPTAIFCFNDMMAFGVFQRLRQRGLSVPGDISLVGFDDVPFSELLDVPLTTVRQPTHQIGCEAARLAIAEIEDPQKPRQSIVLEPELIVRESTRPL